MNVLVVGGAGYIGGAVTDLLPEARVYDNLLYEHEYRKDREFILGDVRDHKKLKEQLHWADAVIWLAGIVGDGACATNPGLTYEINTESVKWLAENFDGRIVFPSTCSVYGTQLGLLDESSQTNPLSVYASSKLKAESYLTDKNAVIFRLGTVYGVSDKFSRIRLDLVVNTMTARAYSMGKLTVFGGEQWRPLIHVTDVAAKIFLGISDDPDVFTPPGIYNLARKNYRMIDLAKEVTKIVPAEIEVIDMEFEDTRNYKVNTLKGGIREISDGIKEILDVLPRIKDPDNPRYSNAAYMEALHVN